MHLFFFFFQAVDSEIAKEQQNIEIRRNLAECLDYHFNLPSSVLLEAMVRFVTFFLKNIFFLIAEGA